MSLPSDYVKEAYGFALPSQGTSRLQHLPLSTICCHSHSCII